jgi:glycine cleavage system H protein
MPDLDEDYPADRRYTPQHQWVMPHDDGDGSQVVGITRFSYQYLDAILSLELPEPGEALKAGELYGHIQSLVGPLQELYAPVSGTVVAVNEELIEDPETIFVIDDPYRPRRPDRTGRAPQRGAVHGTGRGVHRLRAECGGGGPNLDAPSGGLLNFGPYIRFAYQRSAKSVASRARSVAPPVMAGWGRARGTEDRMGKE